MLSNPTTGKWQNKHLTHIVFQIAKKELHFNFTNLELVVTVQNHKIQGPNKVCETNQSNNM